MTEADSLIAQLGLTPHPEGGHYRQTFRDLGAKAGAPGPRGHSTAIFFLLRKGEISRWHRIDAAEVWHFYRGAPLALSIGLEGGVTRQVLGPAVEAGELPQLIVPPGAWQMAESLGDYTLVGCTVAPGFDFATFELADEGFNP